MQENESRKMGYRLVLRQLEHSKTVNCGSSLPISMTWENVGVAPPYRDHFLAFRITDAESGRAIVSVSDTSIKGWLPGEIKVNESFKLPEDLKPGRYEIALAIVDPNTEKPVIRLAIAGQADDGWYPLSQMEVIEASEKNRKTR